MVKKISFGIIFLFIIGLLSCFVLADMSITLQSASYSPDTPLYIGNPIYPNGTFLNFTITTSGTNPNFTINMTNFTLSAGLIFNYSTQGSDALGNFSNLTSGLLLTWQNQTGALIPNGTAKSFWFNVSGKDGVYNITITTMDRLGNLNRTSFNITIDKINPVALLPYNSTIAQKNNYTGSLYYGAASPWIFLNVTINDTNLANITFNLYNVSNFNIRSNVSTITQTTNGMIGVVFNWTGLSDGFYWFNVLVTDKASRTFNTSATASNITIDITPPAVTITDSGIKNLNLTGLIDIDGIYNSTSRILTINATLIDAIFNISTSRTVFNITNTSLINLNSSGSNCSTTFIAVRDGSTNNFYNSSLNISLLEEGTYTITVVANDTIGNLNTSESTIFKVDRSKPSVVTIQGTTTQTTLNITVTASDVTSGVKNCVSTSGTVAGIKSVYSTGLSCNTAYTFNISCYDYAGNLNSSEISATTSSCSASAGGVSTIIWTMTYSPLSSEFNIGYTKELFVKNRVKINVSNTDHYVGIIALTTTTATINVSSTPQQAIFNIGDEKKFDVNSDNYYDIYVKLNNITNSKASITINRINELKTTTSGDQNAGAASGTGDDSGTDTDNKIKGSIWGKWWVWTILIVIILVIVAGIIFGVEYYNHKKKY